MSTVVPGGYRAVFSDPGDDLRKLLQLEKKQILEKHLRAGRGIQYPNKEESVCLASPEGRRWMVLAMAGDSAG